VNWRKSSQSIRRTDTNVAMMTASRPSSRLRPLSTNTITILKANPNPMMVMTETAAAIAHAADGDTLAGG
jgi:hypothetical protein